MSDSTRMIAMGKAPLMEGFALLGFETWFDAGKDDVEQLIGDVVQQEQKAFILLESYLAHFNIPLVRRIRENGGDIIITEIPSFDTPDDYHLVIDDLILQALGPNALND